MKKSVSPLLGYTIVGCALSLLILRTAMLSQADVGKGMTAGDSIAIQSQILTAALCDKCGLTNVSGAVPDRKLIAPILNSNSDNIGINFETLPTNFQKNESSTL